MSHHQHRTTPGRRSTTIGLLLSAPIVAGVAACTPADVVAPASARAAVLTDFGSCEDLLTYFRTHALEQVGPWGFGSGVPFGPWDMAASGDAAAEDDAGADDRDVHVRAPLWSCRSVFFRQRPRSSGALAPVAHVAGIGLAGAGTADRQACAGIDVP